jgi:excisionase family DNA binding protein
MTPGIAAAGLALEALLGVPEMVHKLEAQVAALQATVDRLCALLPPQLVTVAEAANRFGVTRQTVRRRIEAGDLRAVKIGGSVRVDLSSIVDQLSMPVSR